jgi:peptide/nickel transport system permease protein
VPKNIFKTENWYKFSRNPLSIAGAVIVTSVVFLAIFAPYVTPYPDHSGAALDFSNMNRPPDWLYFFGTDGLGRDVFTRVIYGYRVSLMLGVVVLSIAVPIGVGLGLIAGYYGGKTEAILMRITDVFLAIPALVLALAIMGFLEPTLMNAMIAVSAMWWPWTTRLVYNLTRSVKTEDFVVASRVVGASNRHIILFEILPNCLPTILTKMTLDMGFVILVAASLSFLGLGVQPPTPDLASMVADGSQYLPDQWWLSVFPGLAILVVVLGFNLLGDGLRDMLDVEM